MINLEASWGDDLMTFELTRLKAAVSKENTMSLGSTRRD